MSQFTVNVIAHERKKLRACQDKLAAGRGRDSHATALGLANAAATIAQRLLILLDNETKGK